MILLLPFPSRTHLEFRKCTEDRWDPVSGVRVDRRGSRTLSPREACLLHLAQGTCSPVAEGGGTTLCLPPCLLVAAFSSCSSRSSSLPWHRVLTLAARIAPGQSWHSAQAEGQDAGNCFSLLFFRRGHDTFVLPAYRKEAFSNKKDRTAVIVVIAFPQMSFQSHHVI